ncbi:protein mono-ADP-ribosyltransferase PARP14-like [Octopus sinensis]|uniref:Poly [ADP-ribose] polymerase n=1 Tax=Octopus sinensis TaxID=2607531 RepID=A0A6P7T2D0_9MOLL|nr:protein mono-ADP-ribosyltransferase PARP14-like [Octopus sinensis]
MEKRETRPRYFLGLLQKLSSMTSREYYGIEINLMIDSISNVSVDVIVNSTNEHLQLDSGAISKLILNAAGPQIQRECNRKYPQGISIYEIAVTKGYNLKCENVFHLVLPPWDETFSHSILVNLTQIITICLEEAEELGAKSLAFPILGAGKLKYPIENLPRTMYEAVKNYSIQNSSQIKDVYFVVYPQDTEIVTKFKEYFQEILTDGSTASSASTKSEPEKSQKKKFRHRNVKKGVHRLWRKFWPFEKNKELVPVTWSLMGDKELFKTVKVTKGPEYDDIRATFRRNLPSYRIIKIERIQNKTLYQGYQALKKKFEAENPKITNEVDGLWHGTAEGAVEGINKSGFNRSYCGRNATVFGEGVYFAKDIQYSANDTYSTPDHHGTKRIYQCSVLVGKVMRGQHGLKVLPDSYNSAVDNIQRPSIYVIFHDSQAYPKYLITFSN